MIKRKFYFKEIKFPNLDKELIQEILKLKTSGKVLDLGCGEGGNSLALAEKGFDVTCVDISKEAIDKVKERAKKEKILINAIYADLNSFEIKEKYDIIIITGVLHLLEQEKGLNLIFRIKEKTKINGMNIIIAFTDRDSTYTKNKLYFKRYQLKELYSDWDLKSYEEYEDYDLEENQKNQLAEVIAIKK